MKKAIFLCLLSLSVCLSKPATEQVASPVPLTTTLNSTTTNQTTEAAAPVHPTENQTAPKDSTAEKKPTTTGTEAQPSNTIPTVPKEKNETKPVEDNKTIDKHTASSNKEQATKTSTEMNKNTTEMAKDTTEMNMVTTKNMTSGTSEKAKETPSTEKAVTTKPTEVPKSDADKHVLQARGFDGASFVGGIVLTLGLLAIGFMGFKYYKNQTERNYHTL